ncbi:hypothetical protein PYCCODRAFT_162725 [Trametes coccinea BRFM310]|uniref:Uncharacterized protein n=1 Tax=Trametes coccinea (strain BRFM310) TaxID=1353009 RepID=A0A1Y2IS07_TRAC3|nr:hypothetical protein PYCCODRAFT_162725 [Trametes coccinea BRFM310]
MPYIVGALVGVSAVGLAGYTWYHMSGAKRIVDTARAAKERYENTKAAAVEKREAIREKALVARSSMKEKSGDLAQRWKERNRASTSEGAGGLKEDVLKPTDGPEKEAKA